MTRQEVISAIRKGELIKVHRENIQCLTGTKVHLASGGELHTDVVIFSTGWDSSQPQFSDSDAAHLGFRSVAKDTKRSPKKSGAIWSARQRPK